VLTGKSILVTENLPVPKVHHDQYQKNAEVNQLQTSDKIIRRQHGLGLHPKRRKTVVKTLRNFVPINRKSTLRKHAESAHHKHLVNLQGQARIQSI